MSLAADRALPAIAFEKAGQIPVVDGNKLLGIVSMTDLITEVINEPA